MKRTIYVEVLISAVGSGVFSLIFALLSKQDISPLFLSTWSIVFLLLIVYEAGKVVSRLGREGYHCIIQGEDIDFASCNFDKISDDADETGETIVNKLNWRLSFDVPDVVRSGKYMANIRIKKVNQFSLGKIRFNIETNEANDRVTKEIDIGQLVSDEYSYADHKFHYNGKGSVKIVIEPADNNAKSQNIFAFDRLELYEIHGASVRGGTAKKIANFITFSVGYLLSPLSWWNDAFVNIPIAYVMALGVKLVDPSLFQSVFVLVYIATNIAGMVLMDVGKNGIFQQQLNAKYYLKSAFISIVYVVLIMVVSSFDFVQSPRWPF